MCGPSGAQTAIAGQQQQLSSTLQGNYNQNYAAQSGILQDLNNELMPIADQGPNQQGFGAAENATLNTQATQGVANNYSKAAQATNMGRTGGATLPAGAQQAEQETLASDAAKQSSQMQLKNTVANYGTGRANFEAGVNGLNRVAQTYDPNATASAASAGQAQAYGSATQNAQSGYQEFGEIAGGVAALAGAGASAYKAYNANQPSDNGGNPDWYTPHDAGGPGEQMPGFYEGATQPVGTIGPPIETYQGPGQ